MKRLLLALAGLIPVAAFACAVNSSACKCGEDCQCCGCCEEGVECTCGDDCQCPCCE